MSTATFNGNAMYNLWNYLQGLSLSTTDRRWLADRLIESTENESEEVMAQAGAAIMEMRMQSEANGNSNMTLDVINEEINKARLERKQKTALV